MDVKTRLILLLSLLILTFSSLAIAAPTGPDSINIWENSTWAGTTSGAMVNTSKGYISSINITSTAQNRNWKAFVGHVMGTFTLNDAGGSTIYDWNTAVTGGEIFATRDSDSIEWNNIRCASTGEINSEDIALAHTGSDNISSTFISSTTPDAYTVAGTSLGSCAATFTYQNNVTQSSNFEEFILHDDTSIIFAAKIENSLVGYSGGENFDFQMLIPENATVGSAQIPYYLYVELG